MCSLASLLKFVGADFRVIVGLDVGVLVGMSVGAVVGVPTKSTNHRINTERDDNL